RVHFFGMLVFDPARNLFRKRPHISTGSVAFIHSRRKVAVRTTRAAKRNMNVDSGGIHSPTDYADYAEAFKLRHCDFPTDCLRPPASCCSLFGFYAACMILNSRKRNSRAYSTSMLISFCWHDV